MTFEQAMMNLFKRLNPVDTTPRQLRGVRNDGTPVHSRRAANLADRRNRDDANSVQGQFRRRTALLGAAQRSGRRHASL
jgi:hypothetical protein